MLKGKIKKRRKRKKKIARSGFFSPLSSTLILEGKKSNRKIGRREKMQPVFEIWLNRRNLTWACQKNQLPMNKNSCRLWKNNSSDSVCLPSANNLEPSQANVSIYQSPPISSVFLRIFWSSARALEGRRQIWTTCKWAPWCFLPKQPLDLES